MVRIFRLLSVIGNWNQLMKIDRIPAVRGSWGKLRAKTDRVRNTTNDVNKLDASRRLAKALG